MSENNSDTGQDPLSFNEKLVGCRVEALDGKIGEISSATASTGSRMIVVNTSSVPLLGSKVMLPAGAIENIDHTQGVVTVALTKEQIKGAPKFDDDSLTDSAYLEKVSNYYSGMGR